MGVSLFYLFAVASIWVASNFVVQSVISGGASPFLITYICNSLFIFCILVFEILRYFGDSKTDPSFEWIMLDEDADKQVDAKGWWTRIRTAKVSLLLCPFWFPAYLSFNLSLKYTTVKSMTILSNTSSLFAFLLSLSFLGEKFTWIKLISILLCMGGSIIVSVGDMESGLNATAIKPLLGDILSVVSDSQLVYMLASFVFFVKQYRLMMQKSVL